MSKKAQVTVFIILGLVILFSISLLVYLQRDQSTRQLVSEAQETAVIPTELQPVNQFVSNCIKKTATEAFVKLGRQGGYINPEEVGITQPNTIAPTESKSIVFSPPIPYWWHLSTENRCDACAFSLEIPPLHSNEGYNSIESQVTRYLNTKLPDCINNFDSFKSQGFSVEIKGSLKTTTNIRDKDIIFEVEFPAIFKKYNSELTLDKYVATLDLDFNDTYELAKEITMFEKNNRNLELITMDIVDSFSGKKDGTVDNELPPISGDSLTVGDFAYWTIPDVKSDLERYLTDYVSLVKVNSQQLPAFNPYTGLLVYAKNNPFIIDTQKRYPKALEASFTYLPFWPIYLDITPNKGFMIETSTIFNPLMPFVGLTDYNFVYDVSYPIMVQIRDRDFENPSLPEGYSFQFALEVNLRNNEPLNTTSLPSGAASYPSPLLCNVNQRNSGDITINVVDALTNQPIDDAIISFTVGERDCVIGTTSPASNNLFKFPTGAIGALNVRKSGYFTYAESFSAQPANVRTVSVRLEPFRERKIELKNKQTIKMPVMANGDLDYEWKLTSPAPVARLQQGDQAIITLTRIGLQGEEPLTIVAKYEPNEDVNISLVPGNYRVDINVIRNFEPGKNFTIKSDKVCWRNPPLFITKDCKTIEAIVFDESMPIAGLSMDEDSRLWQVTKDKLDNSKKITFYSVGPTMPMVEKHTDLGELANYDNYTISYRPLFEPEFS